MVNLRYKKDPSGASIPFEFKIFDKHKTFSQSSSHMKLVSSAASFAMVLRNSEYKGDSSYKNILSWLELSNLPDQRGFKEEFESIIRAASRL